MIKDLIKRTFELRDAAHIEHWSTDSYSKHKALGHLYEDMVETIDDIVEAYQGTFGIIHEPKNDCSQKISDEIVWLHENRSDITKGIPALENLVDELTALHMKTLYKLQNLK